MARSDFTKAQRDAWQAQRLTAERARGLGDHMARINALPRVGEDVFGRESKLNRQLDADLQKRIDQAVASKVGSNSKQRGKGFELDCAGKCLSEGYWSPRDGGTLYLTFARTGDDYIYYGVPRSVAREVTSGEDFNDLIRDVYEYE